MSDEQFRWIGSPHFREYQVREIVETVSGSLEYATLKGPSSEECPPELIALTVSIPGGKFGDEFSFLSCLQSVATDL